MALMPAGSSRNSHLDASLKKPKSTSGRVGHWAFDVQGNSRNVELLRCVAHGGAAWDHSGMVRALEKMANFEVGQKAPA